MSSILVGILSITGFLVLLGLGVHLAIAFVVIGLVGMALIVGLSPALSVLGQSLYYTIAVPSFCCLPLFILMGAFAAEGGFASKAYDGVYKVTKGIPGSLAVATSFGCAAFGAVSGSSMATAVLFGKLSYPQMERYKYNKSFALGSIACAGTLACMIPPSGMFILFAIFTGQSVGKLFMAGIIPGLITAMLFALLIIVRVSLKPSLAPRVEEEQITWGHRLAALRHLWSIVLLIGLVLGGIYTGVFSPTEAAAAGAMMTLILGIWQGKLRHFSVVKGALRETAHATAMLFFIIATALFFSRFLALSGIPVALTGLIEDWAVSRYVVLAAVLAVWFLLGMIIVNAGVFALTLPVIFPIMVELGYNPIWFCVVAMLLNEVAGVTPPVGIVVYALKGAVGERITLEEIFVGVWPFLLCIFAVLGILLIFPKIPLFLPNLMF
ncbi:C4-dicarboxylate TRAP transporter large permease protein DctM [subsurface metagenome]